MKEKVKQQLEISPCADFFLQDSLSSLNIHVSLFTVSSHIDIDYASIFKQEKESSRFSSANDQIEPMSFH